jgi:hypothetical protein
MEESKMNWKRLVVMVVVNIFLCLAFLPDYGAARELKKGKDGGDRAGGAG